MPYSILLWFRILIQKAVDLPSHRSCVIIIWPTCGHDIGPMEHQNPSSPVNESQTRFLRAYQTARVRYGQLNSVCTSIKCKGILDTYLACRHIFCNCLNVGTWCWIAVPSLTACQNKGLHRSSWYLSESLGRRPAVQGGKCRVRLAMQNPW